jgi:hypothetical protein
MLNHEALHDESDEKIDYLDNVIRELIKETRESSKVMHEFIKKQTQLNENFDILRDEVIGLRADVLYDEQSTNQSRNPVNHNNNNEDLRPKPTHKETLKVFTPINQPVPIKDFNLTKLRQLKLYIEECERNDMVNKPYEYVEENLRIGIKSSFHKFSELTSDEINKWDTWDSKKQFLYLEKIMTHYEDDYMVRFEKLKLECDYTNWKTKVSTWQTEIEKILDTSEISESNYISITKKLRNMIKNAGEADSFMKQVSSTWNNKCSCTAKSICIYTSI